MSDQPNILFVQADQLTAFVLSMYRDDAQSKTPNLDALAAEGVVMENAYSNSPICCPARASQFSGRLPSTHEVWGNGAEFRAEIPTVAHFLRAAGYECVVSGKCHFIGPDQLHGFDRRLTTDMYPSGFDWTIPWSWGPVHREGTSVKKLAVSGLCKTNNQLLYDAEVQYRSLEFLRSRVLESHDQPWFLHVSYPQPHEAYQSVPEYWGRYDDTEIALPRIPADEAPHPTTEWLHIHHGIDQAPPCDDTIRASRRAYYAMISHLDDYVGELVAELKHLGLYDDTVIVFTSDHGDMLGERGMWFKRSFYQGSLQVPMIWHNPKRIAPGRRAECVSLADLCPTFAELGGARETSDRYGSDQSGSFLGLLMARSDSVKDEAIAEYFGPGVIEPWLAIRQGDFKYAWTRNAPELLFDLARDPDEQTDLSTDPAHAAIKTQLKDRLLGRYDVEAMTRRAAKEKETRSFLHDALSTNGGYHWDYQPLFDASRQYVRGVNKPATV